MHKYLQQRQKAPPIHTKRKVSISTSDRTPHLCTTYHFAIFWYQFRVGEVCWFRFLFVSKIYALVHHCKGEVDENEQSYQHEMFTLPFNSKYDTNDYRKLSNICSTKKKKWLFPFKAECQIWTKAIPKWKSSELCQWCKPWLLFLVVVLHIMADPWLTFKFWIGNWKHLSDQRLWFVFLENQSEEGIILWWFGVFEWNKKENELDIWIIVKSSFYALIIDYVDDKNLAEIEKYLVFFFDYYFPFSEIDRGIDFSCSKFLKY